MATLRKAGISLGIISKSTEFTIHSALQATGLLQFFDGPLVAKAGFEGKAGFIKDLVSDGALRHLGADGIRHILLIDDDVSELERACEEGIQTYPAPSEGGLQEDDFISILHAVGLEARFTESLTQRARDSGTPDDLIPQDFIC